MSETPSTPSPAPPRLLLFFSILLIPALAWHPFFGTDPFWHLSNGRFLWERWAIPWTDVYSFTVTGQPCTSHSLLFDLVLEAVYRIGGIDGLRVLRGILPVGFAFSLFALLRHKLPGRYRAPAWLSILSASASLTLSIPRPYWVPLVLLPLCWLWVDRALTAEEGGEPPLWQYFALALLWANLHSSVILAVGAPGFALVFDGYWRGRARHLLKACATAAAASLLNPNGVGLWLYILALSRNTSHMRDRFVVEWEAPSLLGRTWDANLAILAFLGVALLWRRRGPRWELAWTAFWVYGYTNYSRQLGLAIMGAVVLAAEGLARRLPAPEEPATVPREGRWVALAAAVMLLASPLLPGPSVEPSLIPTGALDPFLETTPLRRIFHPFRWGGYISWRSDHRVRAFLDGRTILFGDRIHSDYRSLFQARPGWEEVLDRYEFDGVLLDRDAPLLDAVLARGGWREQEFPHPDYRLVVRREGPVALPAREGSRGESGDPRATPPRTQG